MSLIFGSFLPNSTLNKFLQTMRQRHPRYFWTHKPDVGWLAYGKSILKLVTLCQHTANLTIPLPEGAVPS